MGVVQMKKLLLYACIALSTISESYGMLRRGLYISSPQRIATTISPTLVSLTKKYSGCPYMILGLQPGANDDKIKHNYRALVKKYHPDNHITGNTLKFQEVQAAYETVLEQSKNNSRNSTTSKSSTTNNSDYYDSQYYEDMTFDAEYSKKDYRGKDPVFTEKHIVAMACMLSYGLYKMSQK
ncbi:MAG: hypothetical protein CL947_01030 [Epsilonproteobacteria bacterium]|nr:hypothetical protein [Campylobacterota bacterium]